MAHGKAPLDTRRFQVLRMNDDLVVATYIFFGIFSPKIGEDEPILTNIFQMGWFNHQPDDI